MNLIVSTKLGHDGTGSPVEYYVVSCKKTAREFNTKEETIEYIKAFLNYDWKKCESFGKLISTLSESE